MDAFFLIVSKKIALNPLVSYDGIFFSHLDDVLIVAISRQFLGQAVLLNAEIAVLQRKQKTVICAINFNLAHRVRRNIIELSWRHLLLRQ